MWARGESGIVGKLSAPEILFNFSFFYHFFYEYKYYCDCDYDWIKFENEEQDNDFDMIVATTVLQMKTSRIKMTVTLQFDVGSTASGREGCEAAGIGGSLDTVSWKGVS